jgi:hypothetical protein
MPTNIHMMVFALLSMVALGVSTYLYKRSTKAIEPTNTTFFYYLVFNHGAGRDCTVLWHQKKPHRSGEALVSLC